MAVVYYIVFFAPISAALYNLWDIQDGQVIEFDAILGLINQPYAKPVPLACNPAILSWSSPVLHDIPYYDWKIHYKARH